MRSACTLFVRAYIISCPEQVRASNPGLLQGTLNASDDQYRVDGEELHNVSLHASYVLLH